MQPRFPTSPPSQPPPYRQLGSGGQQPVRIQMIIGLVVGLVLVAVPLYLWRRPDAVAEQNINVPTSDGGLQVVDGATAYVPLVDAAALKPKVRLAPFKTIRCMDPGPGKTPPERCDHVTYFEDALTRAVQENVLCAPTSKEGVVVSIVMDFNFRRKRMKVYHGKSSSVSRRRTKELFRCIRRAMPTPEWGSVPHQHSRYVVNVKATYPPRDSF